MKNTVEKLITKSFNRLLDKGIHRGFITYEELGKSLGKRHFSQENIEKAIFYIFDNKVSFVKEKKDYRPFKKKESSTSDGDKSLDTDKSDDPIIKKSESYNVSNKTSDLKIFKEFLLNKIKSPFTNINYEIKKGDTIQKILKKYQIQNSEIQTIINQYKKYSNPNKLMQKNKIDIIIEKKPSENKSRYYY